MPGLQSLNLILFERLVVRDEDGVAAVSLAYPIGFLALRTGRLFQVALSFAVISTAFLGSTGPGVELPLSCASCKYRIREL